MQLAYIIPADAAETSNDGKIFILGGEISEITPPSYPAFGIRLAFVVKLLFERDEVDNKFNLQFDIINSGDELIFPRLDAEIAPQDSGETPIPFLLILNMPPLMFPTPDNYHCRFFVNGTLLKVVPLRLKSQQSLEKIKIGG